MPPTTPFPPSSSPPLISSCSYCLARQRTSPSPCFTDLQHTQQPGGNQTGPMCVGSHCESAAVHVSVAILCSCNLDALVCPNIAHCDTVAQESADGEGKEESKHSGISSVESFQVFPLSTCTSEGSKWTIYCCSSSFWYSSDIVHRASLADNCP